MQIEQMAQTPLHQRGSSVDAAHHRRTTLSIYDALYDDTIYKYRMEGGSSEGRGDDGRMDGWTDNKNGRKEGIFTLFTPYPGTR